MRNLIVLASLSFALQARAATLVVDLSAPPGGFHRISDAVAAAAPGDTIEISAGVYTDEDQPIVVDKPGLTLVGVPARAAVVRPPMPVKDGFPAIFYVTGAGVTIRGLSVDGQHNAWAGIFVDGAAGFAIRDNWIRFAWVGVFTRQAGGTLDGNVIGSDSDSSAGAHSGLGLGGHFGAVIAGGSAAEAAEVWVTNNLVSENGFSGIACTGDRATVPPSLGTPPEHAPGQLTVHVLDNTFARNGSLGLSFVPYENHFGFSQGDEPSALVGDVQGNQFTGNGYGFVVHTPIGAFMPDQCAGAADATISATLAGNTFAGNAINDALFTFAAFIHTVYGLPACYVHDNRVTVTGAPSFDYDAPANDPVTGSPLNDSLTVNHAAVQGQSLTPHH
jgi:hypothetical protein